MVTIVCDSRGFHMIRVPPSECKFNSSYYQSEIVGPLSEWRSEQAGAASRRLIGHLTTPSRIQHPAAAEASQKFIEENAMVREPRPAGPESPDLASSDLYIFGDVKQGLRRQSFETADELFSSIEAVLRVGEKSILNAVFLEWMERLEQCNSISGDYFEDIQKRLFGRISFIQ
jgi:hypothetical protein